jgi:hypothetical protein
MIPYKLGIQVSASGGSTCKNHLATATSGINTAGQVGEVSAVGVNALDAAAQPQADPRHSATDFDWNATDCTAWTQCEGTDYRQ